MPSSRRTTASSASASSATAAARRACGLFGRCRHGWCAKGCWFRGCGTRKGIFDLPTNEALAAWERKNDIFGWGFLGGETLAALQRPIMDLHFDTFRRILMERVADSAAILEDGSVSSGAKPATYRDAGGKEQRGAESDR